MTLFRQPLFNTWLLKKKLHGGLGKLSSPLQTAGEFLAILRKLQHPSRIAGGRNQYMTAQTRLPQDPDFRGVSTAKTPA